MLFNNDKAVSPVVATLVLVVVAIIGAAAVGVILGTFSSDVSDEASAGETSSATSTELIVAGSTTVQPLSVELAEAYMADHKGVKITVQGGGSGAGVSSVGMGIVDIGAASRDIKDTEKADYPTLKEHLIGGSAVVVIANAGVTPFSASQDDLFVAYRDNTPTTVDATITKLYQRAEASGTEDTFVEWLEDRNGVVAGADFTMNSAVEGATGNQGVIDSVASTAGSLGFVDFGFANGNADVVILGIIDDASGTTYANTVIDGDAIEEELSNEDGASYVTSLTRPLYYITSGEPNTMQQAFISFAQSPGAADCFETVGYFPVTAFK